MKNKIYKYPPKFVYSRLYFLEIGYHVFPAVKFQMLYKRMQGDSRFKSLFNSYFYSPPQVSWREIGLVHDPHYVDDMKEIRETKRVQSSELPLTRNIIKAFRKGTGGTILAARLALEHGFAMNLTGGFHHAYPGHAEGFCYLNDVAIACRVLQQTEAQKRILIIDLDVHQGNGTAVALANDANIFTFSMHQEKLYPKKEKSSLDIGLEIDTEDEEYLSILRKSLDGPLSEFHPDFIFYLAGADPYHGDRLGSLKLTKNGLIERDRLVRDFCYERNLPVAVILAGGYAAETSDTIDIHFNTALSFMRHY